MNVFLFTIERVSCIDVNAVAPVSIYRSLQMICRRSKWFVIDSHKTKFAYEVISYA